MTAFDGFKNSLSQTVTSMLSAGYPPIDVYQVDNQIVVRTAPLDGLDPTTIEVEMQDKTLIIRGVTKDTEQVIPQSAYIRQERIFGTFTREIMIPVPVHANQAKAKVNKGVLTVYLPTVEQNPSEIISIQVAD